MAKATRSADRQAALRTLPSVDQLLRRIEGDPALAGIPRMRLLAAVRDGLAAERQRILATRGERAGLDLDGLAGRMVAELSRAGASIPWEAIFAGLGACREAWQALQGNVSPRLTLEVLLGRLVLKAA